MTMTNPRNKYVVYYDLIFILTVIFLIGLMIVIFNFIKSDGGKCVLNPINYTMTKNPNLNCYCTAYDFEHNKPAVFVGVGK